MSGPRITKTSVVEMKPEYGEIGSVYECPKPYN